MHACGHDFHMTIASSCLERALEEQPKNICSFLFQIQEENEAGGMLRCIVTVFLRLVIRSVL